MNDTLYKEETVSNYLLVEGSDDAQVFFHLLQHHHLSEHIKIEKKVGIEKLLEDIDVELDRSGLKRLGIIVDADTNIETRWQSLRNRLRQSGYTSIPLAPLAEGTIISQEERPKVGIWLMPTNTLPGMLEDFISFLVPSDDILWPVAIDTVKKVVQTERRFPQVQVQKANVHTWLAWQKEPGKPMGQAITKKYFDANAPHAQRIIQWLRQLFELEEA